MGSLRQSLALPAFVLACAATTAHAVTSTEFWFAPPDVTDVYNPPGGEPLYLVVTNGVLGATVTVDQPANGSFTPIVFTLGAYEMRRVNLTPFKPALETRPTNTVANSGLHVSATAPVEVVYEVANSANAEDFPLRGNDALGTAFTIPLHKYSPFANHSFAAPHQAFASFDIVATRNGTTVLMYSPVPVDGHPALQQFGITLNRGQTYSGAYTGAGYELPSTHPGGAVVLADKPVAITLKDDAVQNAAGSCYDLMGDQIVPESALGHDYIATEGAFADESLFIHATRSGTQLFLNGSAVPVATLFAGESYRVSLSGLAASADDAVFIHASEPVYASQVGGSGCEAAMALLPPIDRGGSRAVDVVRRTVDDFTLHVVAPADVITAFTFNNNPTIVPSFVFKDVPGTGGAWKVAIIPLATALAPVEQPLRLENFSGRFFAAFASGGGSSAASFGYRTDFLADVSMTVALTAVPAQVSEPGAVVTYTVAVANTGSGPVLLSSLVDSRLGNLQGRGNCGLPQTIAIGGTYQCSYAVTVSGNPGDVVSSSVSAQAQSLGTALVGSDGTEVTVQDVPPALTFAVEASRTLVGPDGDDITFQIHITNPSVEPLTRSDLRRDGASLGGVGDCAVGGMPIAPGATYTCAVTAHIAGAHGATRILHFTAEVMDDDGGSANASVDVGVTIDSRIFGDGFD